MLELRHIPGSVDSILRETYTENVATYVKHDVIEKVVDSSRVSVSAGFTDDHLGNDVLQVGKLQTYLNL